MSSRRTGPSGPATFESWLSPTGTPVSLVIGTVWAATGPANTPAIPKAMIVRISTPSHLGLAHLGLGCLQFRGLRSVAAWLEPFHLVSQPEPSPPISPPILAPSALWRP